MVAGCSTRACPFPACRSGQASSQRCTQVCQALPATAYSSSGLETQGGRWRALGGLALCCCLACGRGSGQAMRRPVGSRCRASGSTSKRSRSRIKQYQLRPAVFTLISGSSSRSPYHKCLWPLTHPAAPSRWVHRALCVRRHQERDRPASVDCCLQVFHGAAARSLKRPDLFQRDGRPAWSLK